MRQGVALCVLFSLVPVADSVRACTAMPQTNQTTPFIEVTPMAGLPYPAEVRRRAEEMFAAGKGRTAIAEALKVPDSTVGVWRREWKQSQSQPQADSPETKQAANEMEVAALEQRLRELRKDTRLAVEPRHSDVEDWGAVWRAAEIENERHIKAARERHTFDLKIPGDKPVAFAFISDQHIAPGNTIDLKRMREDAEMIAATDGVYAILGGDGVDNHVKHKTAIIASRSTPNDQWRMFNYYLSIFASKIAVVISGNHDCLDEQTEVFTDAGWKLYTSLSGAERVYGINRDTEHGEWQDINEVVEYDSPGTLRRLHTEIMDLVCTDNHRILSKNAAGPKRFEFRAASEFTTGIRGIPVAGKPRDMELHGISDDELTLVAWIMTDGWIIKGRKAAHQQRYAIGQRESNAEQIRELLQRLAYQFTEDYRPAKLAVICGKQVKSAEPFYVFRLLGEANHRLAELLPTKKEWPHWVEKLSGRQFRVLLDGLIEGDGSTGKYAKTASVLYGEKWFLDFVQAACIMQGVAANACEYRPNAWRLHITRKRIRTVQMCKQHWEIHPHVGKVWCLRVPLQNFLVRRSGKAFFTGNSWTEQIGGFDATYNLMKQQKLCYAPDEARLNVTVGEQPYKLAVRHQYRFNSTMNQTHTVKQWWRFGEEDFDVGCVCHHHDPAAEDFLAHGTWRWACRPGSYQTTSGYSRQYGFNRTFPTCPTVVLWPNERRLCGHKDLADGLIYLKGARS